MRSFFLSIFTLLMVSSAVVEGRTQKLGVQFVFHDIASPQTVERAVLANQALPEVPANSLSNQGKGPVVPEPPLPTARTSPLNQALSAATASLVNTGRWDALFNRQNFTSLARPAVSSCSNFPTNPTGDLLTVLRSGALRVGYYELAPHAITGAGLVGGWDVDFVREVAKEIGRHYNLPVVANFTRVQVDPSTLFSTVSSGLGSAYDTAIQISESSARKGAVDFACPYNYVDYVFLRGTKDSGFRNLTSIAALNRPDVLIATYDETNPIGKLARTYAPLAAYVTASTSADIFQRVQSGTVHAAFDVGFQLRYYASLDSSHTYSFFPIWNPPAPVNFGLITTKF